MRIDAMTSDLDVYRSAKLLIEQHGDKASIHTCGAGPRDA